MSTYTRKIDVTIAASGSLSDEIDLRGYELDAILMPAAWTAADLTFQAAEKSGGTFRNVYDDAGNEVTVSADASLAIPLSTPGEQLRGLRFIKVRSGTSGAAVNQAAERTVTLVVKHRS